MSDPKNIPEKAIDLNLFFFSLLILRSLFRFDKARLLCGVSIEINRKTHSIKNNIWNMGLSVIWSVLGQLRVNSDKTDNRIKKNENNKDSCKKQWNTATKKQNTQSNRARMNDKMAKKWTKQIWRPKQKHVTTQHEQNCFSWVLSDTWHFRKTLRIMFQEEEETSCMKNTLLSWNGKTPKPWFSLVFVVVQLLRMSA